MSIVYEHPMNDLMRVALRLEQLLMAMDHEIEQSDIWASRHALRCLMEILYVTDRTDLRTKLAQAIQMHIEIIHPLQNKEGVDPKKLDALLNELKAHAEYLHQQHGKFGQHCRNSHFLSPLNNQSQAGSLNDLAHPSYQLWLRQSDAKRQKDLKGWRAAFEPLHKIIGRLLQLTRDQGTYESHQTQHGFFQMALPNRPIQLLRIAIPLKHNVYPTISVGRHRLSVRIMKCNGDEKAVQDDQDIAFKLAICAPFEKNFVSWPTPSVESAEA